MLQVNVVGPFLVTKHFLPLLKKKNTKVVINTSSICGSISTAASGAFKGFLLPYNCSKAAINMRKALTPSPLHCCVLSSIFLAADCTILYARVHGTHEYEMCCSHIRGSIFDMAHMSMRCVIAI